MTKRPTFFLSSTIYDFRDLRGAIKHLLETRGCRVLASECNDFPTNLDQHSYEACLSNIEQADYFLLLVGGRVGGWYDEPKRISITQQEYRYAYERHKAGALRIVTLARDEVWQLREDRKALMKHLAFLELTDRERQQVSQFPSRFVTDAEFVSSFLTEIGRNFETAHAVKRGTEKPTGNWIHIFRDFRDVADVLHPLTFGGLTADEAAYGKALQNELLEVFRSLMLKHKGKPLDPRPSIYLHLEAHRLTIDQREDPEIYMDGKEWDKFSTLFYQLYSLPIEMTVLPDALTSSLFLDYDGALGSYIQTEAYGALDKLIKSIRSLNTATTIETLATVIEFSPRSRGGSDIPVYIPAQKLALLHHVAMRWSDILSLSKALILHLDGQPFVMPSLMPRSPLRDMDQELDAETVSQGDARRYLGI
jgi:hypothetical protein